MNASSIHVKKVSYASIAMAVIHAKYLTVGQDLSPREELAWILMNVIKIHVR